MSDKDRCDKCGLSAYWCKEQGCPTPEKEKVERRGYTGSRAKAARVRRPARMLSLVDVLNKNRLN